MTPPFYVGAPGKGTHLVECLMQFVVYPRRHDAAILGDDASAGDQVGAWLEYATSNSLVGQIAKPTLDQV